MDLTLVVGSKNISSWSLRPWLVMKHTGAPFQEIVIPLDRSNTREQILRYSPSGRVPVLLDGDAVIWDSLAICEYLAERFPEVALWPSERRARAEARSISSEMHSGFVSLRQQLSMTLQKKVSCPDLKPDTLSDVKRIQSIWTRCLEQSGGPFLFGPHFSIADAMFAPVVTRFHTYSVPIDRALDGYMRTILQLPSMQQWVRSALEEKEESFG